MKCTCPKCQGKIDLALNVVSEEGTTASCPVCKATITVFSESFGGRALRKTGEITCAACGEDLGPQMHCEHCGTSFPQYLVACQGRKKAPKKAKVKLKSSPFKRSSKPADFASLDAAMSGSPLPKKLPAGGGKPLPKGVALALTVVLIMAAAAGGYFYYTKKKVEAAYMKNYARTVYGIQVGINMSRTVCQKMATEWKTSVDSGKVYTPRINMDDERELQAISGKLDSIKSKCAVEPEKFKGSNDKFARLEGTYKKMQGLALSPGTSLPAFTESMTKIEGDYKRAANEFKSSISPEIMEELQSASKIYRDLRPLLK